GGVVRARLIRTLVLAQIVLSLVVLLPAGLFVRTLQKVSAVQAGFDGERGVAMRLGTAPGGGARAAGLGYFRQADGLGTTLAGAQAASLTMTLPLAGSWRTGVRLEAQPASVDIPTDYDLVGPRYFQTMGVAIVSGREFTALDRVDTPAVAIVNETFARRMFPE